MTNCDMSDIAQKLTWTVNLNESIYIFHRYEKSQNYIENKIIYSHDDGDDVLFDIVKHSLRIRIVCSVNCAPLRACHLVEYMEKRSITCRVRE